MFVRIRTALIALALAVGLALALPAATATASTPCNSSTTHYGYHASQEYFTGNVFFHYGYHLRYYGGSCGFGGDVHGTPHTHSR